MVRMYDDRLRDEGKPLDARARGRFANIAHGLDQVRLHTGADASALARREDAEAVTIGRHIAFRDGLPPATVAGDLLLAHELAHAMQQGQAETRGGRWASASAGAEAEADSASVDMVLRGRAPTLTPSRGLRLDRCARPSGTLITPAHFQFTTTVPHTGGGPGGWRAAQVRARMSRGVAGGPGVVEQVYCQFEVGVPIETHAGFVSESQAQAWAATTANSAAYSLLSVSPATASTCIAFRRLMQAKLQALVPGARVSTWVTPGLTPVDFPP